MLARILNSKNKLALLLTSAWVLGLGGISFYTPAMPSLQTAFHTSDTLIKLSISYFILGKAISMLLAIPIADWFQRKTLLIIGIALFTIGSFICLNSPNIDWFLLGRFIEGLGVSLCILMGRAYINDQFPAVIATSLFSIIFIGNALAITILPIAAGYVTTFLGWRYIFLCLTAWGVIVFVLMYYLLPKGSYQGTESLYFKLLLSDIRQILSNPYFIGFMLSLSFMDAGEKVITTLAPFIFIQTFHLSNINFGYLQSLFWCLHLLGLLCCGLWVFTKGLDKMIGIGAVLSLFVVPCLLSTLFISQWVLPLLVLGLLFYMLSTGFIVTTSLVGVVRPFPNKIGLATALAMSIEFFLGFLLTHLVSNFQGHRYQELVIPLIFISAIVFISWYFLIRIQSRKNCSLKA